MGIVEVHRNEAEKQASTRRLGKAAVPIKTGDGQRKAKEEPRVDLESRASPLLVPPGYDAALGICSAHWAMPVRVRPVFPASL